MGGPAALDDLAGVGEHLVLDLEAPLRVEPEDLLDRGDLVGAQRRAVRLAGVHLVRRRVGDDGAQLDERRAARSRPSRWPARRGCPRRSRRPRRPARASRRPHSASPCPRRGRSWCRPRWRSGCVVDDDEVAQLLVPGQRGRLAGDALLDVAVGGDDVDVVVERALAGAGVGVEQAALAAGGHRHAHRGGEPLPERAGGDLDAGGVAVLGVAGRLRAPGAQRLDVLQLQPVARQVQLQVEGEAGVAGGEHEPVAADPVRVARVVPHDPLEQRVGQRRQAHRGAGVAVPGLLHGVGGQYPDRVDGPAVQLGPVRRELRAGEGADLGLRHGHSRCSWKPVGSVG